MSFTFGLNIAWKWSVLIHAVSRILGLSVRIYERLLRAILDTLLVSHPLKEDRAIHTITLAVTHTGCKNPAYGNGGLPHLLFSRLKDSVHENKPQAPFVRVQRAVEVLLFAPQATLSSSSSFRQGTSCLSYVGLFNLVFKPSTINTQAKINFLGNLGKGRQFWKDLL